MNATLFVPVEGSECARDGRAAMKLPLFFLRSVLWLCCDPLGGAAAAFQARTRWPISPDAAPDLRQLLSNGGRLDFLNVFEYGTIPSLEPA